jgi:pre-60S factor REI1
VVGDCQVCNKRFQSQGAAEQHVKSKKHKEAVAAAAAKKPVGEKHTVPEHIRQQIRTKQAGQQVPVQDSKAAAAMPVPAPKVEESNSADAATATSTVTVTDVPEEKEKTQEELLDERIQNAIRLTELDCLFCTHKADDFEGFVCFVLNQACHLINSDLHFPLPYFASAT